MNRRAVDSLARLVVIVLGTILAGACPVFGATDSSSVAHTPAKAPLGRSTQIFDEYGSAADSSSLIQRLLSPLASEAALRTLAKIGRSLNERTLDLSAERFEVYVPDHRPPAGYGVLVFVSASDRVELPPPWRSVLEARGFIFVAAQKSGNDQSFPSRRAPLALLAAENIARRYPVDPRRVFVGGFSGGSRVAWRLALAYPDIFRGALLNAGSDPLGTPPVGLPVAPRLNLVREESRFALVTGAKDLTNVDLDAVTASSLRHWCVFGFDTVSVAGDGHDITGADGLDRGLRVLLDSPVGSPERLAACRARTDAEVAARLNRAAALVAAANRDQARKALLDLDASVGGLVAPELRDLAGRCGCGALPP